MIIYPAIDLYGGKAVRLYKGDYGKMTVYSDEPWKVAAEMAAKGADHIHIVDLEGAKNGGTPNIETVLRIKNESGAFCEIGGGIRSEEVIDKYISSGIDRVILGTAAAENAGLVAEAVKKYGKAIAVGADIKEGKIAVRGWMQTADISVCEFFDKMTALGVRTVICTDISKHCTHIRMNHTRTLGHATHSNLLATNLKLNGKLLVNCICSHNCLGCLGTSQNAIIKLS